MPKVITATSNQVMHSGRHKLLQINLFSYQNWINSVQQLLESLEEL